MRAVVVERFGGPDVLELKEIERPEPGPGELLVRVVCAGTNPVDAKLRQFGGGARVSAPVVLGYDVSGVVEAAGPGVSNTASTPSPPVASRAAAMNPPSSSVRDNGAVDSVNV